MNKRFLLDTCTVIWPAHEEPISRSASSIVTTTAELPVSPVTAWEMTMLISREKIDQPKGAKIWFEEFLAENGAQQIGVTADIFIASCSRPRPLHKDPIDHILIATARQHDLTPVPVTAQSLPMVPPVTSRHCPAKFWSF